MIGRSRHNPPCGPEHCPTRHVNHCRLSREPKTADRTGHALVELLRAREPHRDPGFADAIERGVRVINTRVEPGDPWTSSSTRSSSSLRKAGNSTQTRGHNDLQIASIAIPNEMGIAARYRDFGRLHQLRILHW